MIEYAHLQKKELWIVLQDMKKAFDSVDPRALTKSLERIGVPAEYIKLHEYINANRTIQVSTAYGLTDPFHPQTGLPQGGVECPLHWLIFYDTILCAVHKHNEGFTMEYTSKNQLRNGPKPTKVKITGLAFMDDTNLCASSKEAIMKTMNIIETFNSIVGISLNTKKTKLIVINPPANEETSFTIQGNIITQVDDSEGERILGVHIAPNLSDNTQREILEESINRDIIAIRKYPMTDQQCLYIQTKLMNLSETYFQKIQTKINTTLRMKSKLPSTFPTEALMHEAIYNSPNIFDEQYSQQTTQQT